jgi:parallel beta-helix repeat protein
VNGKPIYYYKNQTSGTVPANAGQVLLANTTNVIVSGLNLSNTTVGIDVGYSSNNLIMNNTIYNNTIHGVRVDTSNGNIIRNNSIVNNLREAVFITDSSTGNHVYHNNFINNNGISIDGYDDVGTNYWDDGSEGNYWSDFDTPAKGCVDGPPPNGICDSPYFIAGGVGARDNYPLTHQLIIPERPPSELAILLLMIIFTFYVQITKNHNHHVGVTKFVSTNERTRGRGS